MSDMTQRLREGVVYHPKRWSGDTHSDSHSGGRIDEKSTDSLMVDAADEIERLQAIEEEAKELGFTYVASGPFVRSSFNAAEAFDFIEGGGHREKR